MTAGLQAQTSTTTKEAGQTQVTTEQITGEVVLVDGNILLARMQPSGQYRMFNIQPSQQFTIDGKSKRVRRRGLPRPLRSSLLAYIALRLSNQPQSTHSERRTGDVGVTSPRETWAV